MFGGADDDAKAGSKKAKTASGGGGGGKKSELDKLIEADNARKKVGLCVRLALTCIDICVLESRSLCRPCAASQHVGVAV